MKTTDGTPNVWPGYVAAVAGLGISLLLLIAVLGLGIFEIGSSIHEKLIIGFKPNSNDETKSVHLHNEEKGDSKLAEIKTVNSEEEKNSDLMISFKNSDIGKILSSIEEQHSKKINSITHNAFNKQLDEPRKNNPSSADKNIIFLFSNGIYKLNKEAKDASSYMIAKHLKNYKVTIWSSASTDIESATRTAYIRILSVRNFFLDSGYERKNIIIKIITVAPNISKSNEINVKFTRDDTTKTE